MLSRTTRQLVRTLYSPAQLRAFASKKDSGKDSHDSHHPAEHHEEDHHDSHHDHHETHEHQGYFHPIKFTPSHNGRVPAPNITVTPDIPHGNPSDPGFDVIEKRKRVMFGTKLNPQRHIYMHNLQMQYDDHFTIGDFPNPDIIAEKEPSKIYKEQAVDLTVKYLMKNVKEFSIQATNWDELKSTSWQVHGIENINELKFAIFDHLADNIIVKENKFRPKIEQRIRKSIAREQLGTVCYNGRSIGEFFEHYNTLLWLLKEESNWFRAPEIPGDYSALEREALVTKEIVGIKDLKSDRPENDNIINKFLKLIHS